MSHWPELDQAFTHDSSPDASCPSLEPVSLELTYLLPARNIMFQDIRNFSQLAYGDNTINE